MVAAVPLTKVTMTSTLKLKAPEALPSSGVSTVQFKAWKNQLFAYLEQDQTNYLFLYDGVYTTWKAREDSTQRLSTLSDNDPELIKLKTKLTKANNARALSEQHNDDPNHRAHSHTLLDYEDDDFQNESRDLLLKRNGQLTKFIALIAVLCHYTKHDDITNRSTSIEWILAHLERHFNIEKKGAHFMKISDVIYKPNTPYMSFYDEFRSAIQDNLRKAGDVLLHNDSEVLTKDEKFSSTFESCIVLWSLEKINPKLPSLVFKRFGHLMVGNKTLIDIHSLVFQQVDDMLEDSDRSSELNKLGTEHPRPDTCNLNYVQPQRRPFQPRRNAPSTRFQPRTSSRPTSTSNNRTFCRICKIAGASTQVVNSHNISTCRFLTQKDKEVLKVDINALTLNNEDDNDDTSTTIEPFLEPGWDDDYEEED